MYPVIKWQEGTVPDAGDNGAQVEDVLDATLARLAALNAAFPCRENALAITHIEIARNFLYQRTAERTKRGVEGQHTA